MNAMTDNDKEIRNRLIRLVMDKPNFIQIDSWNRKGMILAVFPKLDESQYFMTWDDVDSFLYQNGR